MRLPAPVPVPGGSTSARPARRGGHVLARDPQAEPHQLGRHVGLQRGQRLHQALGRQLAGPRPPPPPLPAAGARRRAPPACCPPRRRSAPRRGGSRTARAARAPASAARRGRSPRQATCAPRTPSWHAQAGEVHRERALGRGGRRPEDRSAQRLPWPGPARAPCRPVAKNACTFAAAGGRPARPPRRMSAAAARARTASRSKRCRWPTCSRPRCAAGRRRGAVVLERHLHDHRARPRDRPRAAAAAGPARARARARAAPGRIRRPPPASDRPSKRSARSTSGRAAASAAARSEMSKPWRRLAHAARGERGQHHAVATAHVHDGARRGGQGAISVGHVVGLALGAQLPPSPRSAGSPRPSPGSGASYSSRSSADPARSRCVGYARRRRGPPWPPTSRARGSSRASTDAPARRAWSCSQKLEADGASLDELRDATRAGRPAAGAGRAGARGRRARATRPTRWPSCPASSASSSTGSGGRSAW